jgi:hypothetical protein
MWKYSFYALAAVMALSFAGCQGASPPVPDAAMAAQAANISASVRPSGSLSRLGFAVAFAGTTDRDLTAHKMVVFARGVSGNAAPLKSLHLSEVYAATAAGNFWAIGFPKGNPFQAGLYSASGGLITALPPGVIDVQKDGRFYTLVGTSSGLPEVCPYVGNAAIDAYKLVNGKPTFVSALTLAKPCNVVSVVVGPDDSLYVATSTKAYRSGDPQTTRILHFALGAAGSAKPVSALYSTYQSGGWDSTQFAVNSHGDVYLALNGKVRVYPNGHSRGTYLFDGAAVAIDSHDNVYVVALAYNKTALRSHFEVNEYAPGAMTPFRSIEGNSTEMAVGKGAGLYPTIALIP